MSEFGGFVPTRIHVNGAGKVPLTPGGHLTEVCDAAHRIWSTAQMDRSCPKCLGALLEKRVFAEPPVYAQ